MRLWGELILLVVFLIVVVLAVVFVVTSTLGNDRNKPKKAQPSEWVATDYTLGNETIVVVRLRRPTVKGSAEFEKLDEREVTRITNGALDYDQLYYNAMQEAASRASVLNALHR